MTKEEYERYTAWYLKETEVGQGPVEAACVVCGTPICTEDYNNSICNGCNDTEEI